MVGRSVCAVPWWKEGKDAVRPGLDWIRDRGYRYSLNLPNIREIGSETGNIKISESFQREKNTTRGT